MVQAASEKGITSIEAVVRNEPLQPKNAVLPSPPAKGPYPTTGWVNPHEVNFTQPGVNKNALKYVEMMKTPGVWDWERPGTAIRVMEIEGQLVSYDNRRLYAARVAGLTEIKYTKVNPTEIMPDSKKTWAKAFELRRSDKRNLVEGKKLPPTGSPLLPRLND